MNTQQQIDELNAKITKLKSDLENLSMSFYKNNFSGSQIFTKDAVFQTRLKVPNYTTANVSSGIMGEVGDIIEVSGVLYICTTGSVNSATFTKVGGQ